jgi:CRP-like cAMP-binding protein
VDNRTIINEISKSFGYQLPSALESINFSFTTLKKKEFFLTQEGPCTKVAFILSGGFRKYYLDKNGREYTTTFCLPGGFATSFVDIIKNTPSSLYIQTIADTKIVSFEYEDFKTVALGCGAYLPIYSEILFSLVEEKEEREKALLLNEAKERLDWLRKTSPQIFQLTTLKNIASYLALDPSTLSRCMAI